MPLLQRAVAEQMATMERLGLGVDADVRPSLTEVSERLLSGGAWACLGKLLTAGSGAAISILLSRLLPPAEVGAYFLALSVVTVASILATAGLEKTVLQLVAESLARGDESRTRAAVYRVYFVAAATGTLIGLGLLAGVSRLIAVHVFSSRVLASVAQLLAPWMALLTIELLLAETFRGFGDIPRASIFGGALSRVTCVGIFSVLLVLGGASDLRTIVALTLGSYLVSVPWGGYTLHRRVSKLHTGDSQSVGTGLVLSATWPFLVTNVTMFAMAQAGLWILGAFRPEDEVALYGVCVRLVMLLGMPLTIAAAVLPPIIGQLYVQEQRKILERVMRMTASVAAIPSVLVLAGFVLAGRPILEFAFGAYYGAGTVALALLSVGQFVNVWVGSCGYTLIMTGHQRDLMVSAVVSGAVTVVGSLAAVDRFGVEGVAAATAVGTIVNQVLMLMLARTRCGIWTHAGPFLLRDGAVFLAKVMAKTIGTGSPK